jgi:hypothetical protein
MIRVALWLALGALGCSSVYWIAYLALPALAALVILQRGGEAYMAETAPRIVRVLRWMAAAYAYLWLLTDAVPDAQTDGPVVLEVKMGGSPSASSALLRLGLSLPALLLLVLTSFLAGALWIGAAVLVLLSEKVPAGVVDFLAATLRYQFRLVAYHLPLVERYPLFEISDITHASASSAA